MASDTLLKAQPCWVVLYPHAFSEGSSGKGVVPTALAPAWLPPLSPPQTHARTLGGMPGEGVSSAPSAHPVPSRGPHVFMQDRLVGDHSPLCQDTSFQFSNFQLRLVLHDLPARSPTVGRDVLPLLAGFPTLVRSLMGPSPQAWRAWGHVLLRLPRRQESFISLCSGSDHSLPFPALVCSMTGS